MLSGLKVIKKGNDCVTLHFALVKRFPAGLQPSPIYICKGLGESIWCIICYGFIDCRQTVTKTIINSWSPFSGKYDIIVAMNQLFEQ